MVKIVPILLGVIASYVVAAFSGLIDFTPVKEAAWIGLPLSYNRTVFSIFTEGADTGLLITAVITIVPIAFATMMEHIGDISAIAPANTTYGENTGVLTLTKVYDPMVIRLAAVIAVVLSFCPKFAAIIEVMPAATIGGISLVLYGMISAVGVRNLVETHCDFSKSRNVLIAALILVLAIGLNFSADGGLVFHVGAATITFSGLATGSLVGILLNAILPGKDYHFSENEPNDTGVDLELHQGENFADEADKKA